MTHKETAEQLRQLSQILSLSLEDLTDGGQHAYESYVKEDLTGVLGRLKELAKKLEGKS